MVEANMVVLGVLLVLHVNFLVAEAAGNEERRNSVWRDSSWYRLPENVVSDSYDLWIYPHLAVNNFTYEGYVDIRLHVLNKTNSLILHVDGLRIDKKRSEVRHNISHGKIVNIPITDQELHTERQFYNISLSKNLIPGNYSLTLSFTGEIRDDIFGFYRSCYKSGNITRWLGITQFSTTYARRAFPCLDEPYLKATYQLHIGHYRNETVTGNTVAEKTEEIKPGYLLTTFARTPIMSTYLVGWAIHDFNYTIALNSTSFGIWSRTEGHNLTSPALRESVKIYDALKKWINVENPVKKMEQIAVPDFHFHAMENWGMVTFRETVVLWEEHITPMKMIHEGLKIISHEYAHTWFGNIVTPKFWNVAWLKEGFATYFEHYALNLVHDDWKVMDMFAAEVLQSALLGDSIDHYTTMNSQNIGSPESIIGNMGFITYKKGGSIVRMMNHLIGDRAFQRGLQSYVNTLKYSYATPTDLYKHLQNATDEDNTFQKSMQISDVIDTWCNLPGYPIVNVTRNYSTNMTKISQERFYLNRSEVGVDPDAWRWWIPLNFASAENGTQHIPKRAMMWLKPEEKNILITTPVKSNESLLCNIDQVYYYRVNYDKENWRRLIEQLYSDFETISPPSRASLLDDAFNLARAGYINYSTPLDLSMYLLSEKEYEPWVAAMNSFEFLNTMLSPIGNVHQAFKAYVRKLVEPIMEKIQFFGPPVKDVRKRLMHDLIISSACSTFSSNHCSDAVLKWNDLGSRAVINPDTLRGMWCARGRMANDDEWPQLMKLFLNTKLSSLQELIISGLGCTNESTFINDFLNYILYNGPEVRKQHRRIIFDAILDGNPTNVKHTLNFVAENLKNIVATRDQTFLIHILESLRKHVVDEEQLQQFKFFISNNTGLLGSALNDAQRAVTFVEANIAWIKIYSLQIADWLGVSE